MTTITRTVNENSRIVTLTIGEPPFSTWTPGQSLRFSIRQGEDWSPDRTFTMSSAPEEGELRITVKVAGPLTAALQNAVPGTEVRIRGPFGVFCKQVEQHPRITLIAGGIGITPFLSVLRHLVRVGTQSRIVLLWANNTADDIICRAELQAIAKKLDFHVVHILWKDGDAVNACTSSGAEMCRQGLLDAATITEYADLAHAEVYLCGPPQMHDMTLDIIRSLGSDPARIHTSIMVPPPAPRPPAANLPST